MNALKECTKRKQLFLSEQSNGQKLVLPLIASVEWSGKDGVSKMNGLSSEELKERLLFLNERASDGKPDELHERLKDLGRTRHWLCVALPCWYCK